MSAAPRLVLLTLIGAAAIAPSSLARGADPSLTVLPWLIAILGASPSCRAAVEWQVHRLAQRDPDVLYYVDTEVKAVALTIDDGPDPVTTEDP